MMMARRGSAMTDISLRLTDDAVDNDGRARYDENDVVSPTDNSTIAPWIDVPPTPPPKSPSRTFGFGSKNSLASLVSIRQGSTSSIRSRGPSESQTTLATQNGKRRSTDEADSTRTLLDSGSSTHSGELRKVKSSLNIKWLRSRTSRSTLRSEDIEEEHPSLRPLPPDEFGSFLDLPTAPTKVFVSAPKKLKRDKRIKQSTTPTPPSPPPKDATTHQYHLDTNLDAMDGIVDLNITSSSAGTESSFSNTVRFPSSSSTNNVSFFQDLRAYGSQTQRTVPAFRNPFSPTPTVEKRKGRPILPQGDYRRVSPTTLDLPLENGEPPIPSFMSADASPDSPVWKAPQSWAVEDPNALEEAGSSSDDEGSGAVHCEESVPSSLTGHLLPPSPHGTNSSQGHGEYRQKAEMGKGHRQSIPERPYLLRIWRTDEQIRVLKVLPSETVAGLTNRLDSELVPGEDKRLQHRLYLRERGRGDSYNALERVLAPTERPADIVRRRMEQAGYEMSDVQLLEREGFAFLLSFVYKSQVLGGIDEEIDISNFEFVNLTGRSLRAIPVVLHKHAEMIVLLKLSRNPMLEIPLDFIQSCTHIRDLKLSNMAMKKIPTSLRHSATLHRLDLSSNRISDLDDAHLGDIPELMYLFLQNNRIEKLPWHFPRLHALVNLNISNNKFSVFPTVVTHLLKLQELDISFNMINLIPPEIGRLKALERFILVGNHVAKFPDEFSQLVSLQTLDCRRNLISDLTIICMLPAILHVHADRNSIPTLDLSIGSKLTTLDVSHNDITKLALIPGPVGRCPYALSSLDLSYAKLSTLDDQVLAELTSLHTLRLDHNSFRAIPDTLGQLKALETLSCSDNKLDFLPSTIGNLQKLETLDAHNNSLTELPSSLWSCASLTKINVTSNFINTWHNPPVMIMMDQTNTIVDGALVPPRSERKASSASLTSGRALPSLVHSLQKLYLGENRLTEDVIAPLMILKELHVLNLSFNEIQDLPPTFFRNMTKLEEIYLSGNKLMSIPAEDLPGLTKLTTLFLNGNKLQTLPRELTEVRNLKVVDAGSNLLKYNINNLEFDWNWNFNKNLKYLNLSGNKRLQIKPEPVRPTAGQTHNRTSTIARHPLSGFTQLNHLRVLGLMDVTITATGLDIPDETEDRRVRTSLSTINGMAYGIADALWENECLNLLDLVHEFRDREGEAIFAIFGRAQRSESKTLGEAPTKLVKFLHDRFVGTFIEQQKALNPNQGESITDALRRTFLKIDNQLNDYLFPPPLPKLPDEKGERSEKEKIEREAPMITDPAILESGATGVVLYFRGKKMYVANVGDALAVVSRQGVCVAVSPKHHPYERQETARIRAAEGWVSPSGLVNGEVNISRAFGFFHLLPVINARPDVFTWDLTERDEFVIVANSGLWEFVPYQTAVDIARTSMRSGKPDPMIAAQKLRDFAISYGAKAGIMIMVISVADIFDSGRSRQPTLDAIVDSQLYRVKKRDDILDRGIARLDDEVPAPTGHLALAFTDIRNSTHLWEVNPGMPTAMRLHNQLLRRQLRFCGGYEVKTEGDAFMCSFPNTLSAVWWCLSVQMQLLDEPWPLEILECEDGKPVYDAANRLIARGLSVRMGIHCGIPIYEPDPITHRMDYFGPMVNRSARINGSAAGGQIMCSAEVIREINAKVLGIEPETQFSNSQPQPAIEGIKGLGVVVIPAGEFKLKGLELPELLSAIYPTGLEGRHDLKEEPTGPDVSGSRVQFSVAQMRELGLLCLRIESLASGRVFRPLPERKGSIQTVISEENDAEESTSLFIYSDPNLLLAPIKESASDTELMMILDSFSVRIHNALAFLNERLSPPKFEKNHLLSLLMEDGGLDEETLRYIVDVMNRL
ncbi:hypothetical protein BDQ12DRAFT_701704 [Crucibulum laeve]|uniref:Adenylate cyclase n=1 Tax=Crucibulum laeve TaxID=68775 RepID=A0A5C3MFF5_9AGAR|nr:hypothetical protein BDQ12DRAFT_701704 [Crucibulum laeve]